MTIRIQGGLVFLVLASCCYCAPSHPTFAADDDAAERRASSQPSLVWQADYGTAKELARDGKKMLLICFHTPGREEDFREFRAKLLADQEIAARLSNGWVLASVPLDARIRSNDQDIAIVEHDAFREMHGKPGIAILDYRDESQPFFGYVVSVLPLGKEGAKYRTPTKEDKDSRWLAPRTEILTLLDLPPGTLTQRTLIFAVRTHGDRPASADGEFHPVLAAETESHSAHQARIRLQGHHSWEQRFHAINAKLSDGSTATEVCAESWSNQSMLEAARECVNSWRQSSGHWSSVRAKHHAFGYDMKRGSNGVWYATGIFARTRS